MVLLKGYERNEARGAIQRCLLMMFMFSYHKKASLKKQKHLLLTKFLIACKNIYILEKEKLSQFSYVHKP